MKIRKLASESVEQLKDSEVALKLDLLRHLASSGAGAQLRRAVRKNLARVLTALNCRSGFNSEVV